MLGFVLSVSIAHAGVLDIFKGPIKSMSCAAGLMHVSETHKSAEIVQAQTDAAVRGFQQLRERYMSDLGYEQGGELASSSASGKLLVNTAPHFSKEEKRVIDRIESMSNKPAAETTQLGNIKTGYRAVSEAIDDLDYYANDLTSASWKADRMDLPYDFIPTALGVSFGKRAFEIVSDLSLQSSNWDVAKDVAGAAFLLVLTDFTLAYTFSKYLPARDAGFQSWITQAKAEIENPKPGRWIYYANRYELESSFFKGLLKKDMDATDLKDQNHSEIFPGLTMTIMRKLWDRLKWSKQEVYLDYVLDTGDGSPRSLKLYALMRSRPKK